MATETGWQRARHEARRWRGGGDDAAAAAVASAIDTALDAALRSLSLRCRARSPRDPLLSGAHAVLDGEAQTIWYRADAAPEERRLFLAHEIGHFLLHHDDGAESGCICCEEEDFFDDLAPGEALTGYGPRQRRETEANVFAREFLLPVAVARRCFHDEGQDAHGIAAQAGLPVALVFSQLAEAIVPDETSAASVPLSPDIVTASAGLDASQEEAARAARGPLLVGAGPGTGKTRTLTARVLFLTRECGVRPDSLLALTFSRKAAEEMRERIAAQAPEVARRACISTFHSFGLDLLRRHWRAAGLPPRPVLLEPVDAFALLERRAATLGLDALGYLHDPAFPLPDILRAISRAKEEMITPEEYEAQARESGEEKLREVARAYAAYEALLREKGALDFSDLACRALRLLEDDTAVLRAERARWKHILVDEYQDVNRAGARLVRLLAGENGAGLWAVGDLRQAIYGFRGASPANVTRFQSDFPNGRRTDLAVNYRSRPALVSLFGAACGEGAGVWKPSRAGGETGVILSVAADEGAQADHIARKMREFVAAGHPFGEQVVLCRTRGQASAMRDALIARGIPVVKNAEENGPLASAEVRRLLFLLSQACEPEGAARNYRQDEAAFRLPDGLPFAGDAFTFFTEALWGKPGLARLFRERGPLTRLLAAARAFRDRADTLLEAGEDPRRAFLAHVRRRVRLGAAFGSGEEEGTGEEASNAAVRVLTVHASKGLEFSVVFVPNLSAGKFPSQPGPSLLPALPVDAPDSGREDAATEEARLFFVALTRARDHLILSRAAKYKNRSAAPSPLLACLDEATAWIRRETWEALAPTPFPSPADGRGVPDTSSSLDWRAARKDLVAGTPLPSEGKGVGATFDAWEVELYLRCPRRFYYERVAGVRTGRSSPYSAFKRAVEGALASESDPAAALEETWAAHGPDDTHPYAGLYRQAAEKIVARSVAPAAASSPAPLLVPLENGTIQVQADVVDASGARVECHTFRKPPRETDSAVPQEMRHSLLFEAALSGPGSQGAGDTRLHLRYLQTGETVAVTDRHKVRERHLAAYDAALRGIGLQVFPPTPADKGDCPSCPCFFICPD